MGRVDRRSDKDADPRDIYHQIKIPTRPLTRTTFISSLRHCYRRIRQTSISIQWRLPLKLPVQPTIHSRSTIYAWRQFVRRASVSFAAQKRATTSRSRARCCIYRLAKGYQSTL